MRLRCPAELGRGFPIRSIMLIVDSPSQRGEVNR
ncbi:hypothetical protein CCP3SC1_80038 [Gammaproteobacteria bacterium]